MLRPVLRCPAAARGAGRQGDAGGLERSAEGAPGAAPGHLLGGSRSVRSRLLLRLQGYLSAISSLDTHGVGLRNARPWPMQNLPHAS